VVTLASAPPRIHVFPNVKVSLADDVFQMAELVGFEFDPWQETVIENSFGVKPDGKWASKEVGVNVPRQNGKGGILEIVELTAIFTWQEKFVIHSAHEFITSQKHFDRVWSLVENTPELLSQVVNRRAIRSHGHEGFKTIHGCQIEFRSRTKSAGRGFSCDRLVFDEAMFLPESAMGALWPTLRARPNPQVWYTGSAVDQDVHNEGLVFTRVRERALRREAELSYFEWSLDYPDPSEVPEEAFWDEDSYWKSNPAYGIRIFKEHFESEVRALERRTVAVELFGVGDYPDPAGSEERPISPEQWAACEQKDSELQGPVWSGFDTSPERRTSVAAAGRNQDGNWHVEVIDKRPGTNWLPARLAQVVAQHNVEEIVCDGLGPSASLTTVLEHEDIEVTKLDGSQYAEACGRFVDVVSEGSLRHRGSLDLMNAIRGAKTRPLGDRWLWSRKNSSVDISPLVAATLALYAAMGSPQDYGEVRFW
jgi:predicted Fe-Mo cluster-binding NifX family protein